MSFVRIFLQKTENMTVKKNMPCGGYVHCTRGLCTPPVPPTQTASVNAMPKCVAEHLCVHVCVCVCVLIIGLRLVAPLLLPYLLQ